MSQSKQTNPTLAELEAKRGSEIKIWWNGLKWILIAAFSCFTSAGAFNYASEGHAEYWVFGTINIAIVIWLCVKGYKAYKRELDEIDAEIAKIIKQGNKKTA